MSQRTKKKGEGYREKTRGEREEKSMDDREMRRELSTRKQGQKVIWG